MGTNWKSEKSVMSGILPNDIECSFLYACGLYIPKESILAFAKRLKALQQKQRLSTQNKTTTTKQKPADEELSFGIFGPLRIYNVIMEFFDFDFDS